MLQWDPPIDTGGEKIHYVLSVTEISTDRSITKIKTEESLSAVFTELSYGEYNFSVQAANCHGRGPPVFIKVSMPNTVYIYTIIVLVSLLIIVAVAVSAGILYRYRREIIQKVNL